jgi:hypothetical protein
VVSYVLSEYSSPPDHEVKVVNDSVLASRLYPANGYGGSFPGGKAAGV